MIQFLELPEFLPIPFEDTKMLTDDCHPWGKTEEIPAKPDLPVQQMVQQARDRRDPRDVAKNQKQKLQGLWEGLTRWHVVAQTMLHHSVEQAETKYQSDIFHVPSHQHPSQCN
jgi:hypothetical protein